MAGEPTETDELLAWLLVNPLKLEDAVSLAVGRTPVFGTPHPRTFTPLLRAAETALETGELKPANGWLNRKARRHHSTDYIEPEVDQAVFRAWLEKALPSQLRGGAFFFFLEPGGWPEVGEDKPPKKKPFDGRERNTLLRILRALDAMAGLPVRGASGVVERELETLGFNTPKEAAIRRLLEESRALEPDTNPL
ncbi:hypothetical protein ISP17_17100 [Dyella ginsengisoli]|uniref:Uncharacterized protein n=1 Tax=Dyella ginsengisoli TaxID=363848 RepID=A0ABW8JYZ2_9GAMM